MISLIVAHDLNLVIGRSNKMPWHYPEDLKYFKNTTMKKNVLVGRNTFESIISYLGKPLPNRTMHVLTSKENIGYDINIYRDVESVLSDFKNKEEELFIAGGAKVYESFMPYADKLYITLINKTFEGDTWFPSYDESDYDLVEVFNQDDLTFKVLEKK